MRDEAPLSVNEATSSSSASDASAGAGPAAQHDPPILRPEGAGQDGYQCQTSDQKQHSAVEADGSHAGPRLKSSIRLCNAIMQLILARLRPATLQRSPLAKTLAKHAFKTG